MSNGGQDLTWGWVAVKGQGGAQKGTTHFLLLICGTFMTRHLTQGGCHLHPSIQKFFSIVDCPMAHTKFIFLTIAEIRLLARGA